jgi:outer membrane immunogenic protein
LKAHVAEDLAVGREGKLRYLSVVELGLFKRFPEAMVRALIIAGVASLAFAGGALASDLPSTKGPPVYAPPPPSFSWTGVYVGVNAGYGGDHLFVGANGPGGSLGGSDIPVNGFVGGGQVGFNYEIPDSAITGANVVLGGETDFDGSTVGGAQTFGPPVVATTGTVNGKLDWLGTARARLGLAFGNVLPYVTGGFAYAHESVSQSAPAAWSIGSTPTGWTAGAGLEYAFARNLSVKAEYLYVDLSRTSGLIPGDAAGVFQTAHPTLNVVRAGLDWKFDWIAPQTPVVSKY